MAREQEIFDSVGIGNLNDMVPDLEGKLKQAKQSQKNGNEQEIQRLVIQINQLKRRNSQAFF